jgi:hypothetical protein
VGGPADLQPGVAPVRRGVGVRALGTVKVTQSKVVTDAAPGYPGVLDELVPAAWHRVEQYEQQPDRSRPQPTQTPTTTMRGLRTDRTATVIIAGLAFMQNLRRGHFELGIDTQPLCASPRP